MIFWIAEARSASSMPERVSLRSSRPSEHHGQVPALLAVAAALTRTPEDDAALLDAYRAGHGIDSLAGTFGRQPARYAPVLRAWSSSSMTLSSIRARRTHKCRSAHPNLCRRSGLAPRGEVR